MLNANLPVCLLKFYIDMEKLVYNIFIFKEPVLVIVVSLVHYYSFINILNKFFVLV